MRGVVRSPEFLIALTTLWIVVTGNFAYWDVIADSAPAAGTWLYLLQISAVTVGLSYVLLLLLAVGPLLRPMLAVALISCAGVGYFTWHYGILFDEEMLVNMIETNAAETRELLSARLLLMLGIGGLLPALLVWRYPLVSRRWHTAGAVRAVTLLATVGLLGGAVYSDPKTVISLARQHREVRHMLSPLNLVSAAYGYSNDRLEPEREFRQVATDATHVSEAGRPLLHVLIIGETARTQNFSLSGYARPTNPELAALPLIYQSRIDTCGTATSVSLPCMFSLMDRGNFDREQSKQQDNLLDIAMRAGYDVHWIDNGNSCKSVCARSVTHTIDRDRYADLCQGDTCFDEVLVEELRSLLPTLQRNTLVVLHQLGSHGPTYYRRYPDTFRRFVPDCRDALLGNCSRQEIINAYDNTILYTDHVIAATIRLLAEQQANFDVSLLYVSDHGESLGENGLFLHGMPYALAPTEQTRVPLLTWLGPGMPERLGLVGTCDQMPPAEAWSHDALFHSELRLLEIATAVYQPELDLLNSCGVPLVHRPAGPGVPAGV